jgi:hypothetical protein
VTGKSEKSARDHFLYYSGKDPSAVRYKNWKMYFAMVSDAPSGFISGVLPYHWTQVVNIKRDHHLWRTAEDALRYGRSDCFSVHRLCL